MTRTPRPPTPEPTDEPATAPGEEPDPDADRLPCGRNTDALIELATSERPVLDEHQRSCVHCRALLAETTRLWSPVHRLAARQETPRSSLLEAIMATVRALGREPLHLVLPGSRGVTRISTTALARIAEQAAASVPGIRLVLARGSDARVDPTTDPASDPAPVANNPVGVAGQHTVIELAVIADHGHPLPDLADRVRTTVRQHLHAHASVGTTTVDIYIHDVLPPTTP